MENPALKIGIYSFPKSGTTWLTQIVGRCFGLDFPEGVHHYIPDMHQKAIMQHPVSGFDRQFYFYKSHRPERVITHRQQPIETDIVLHIRRNPLDVFLSYMNYISDNVKGNAPLPFPSVEAIKNSELFDTYFKSFTLWGSVHAFASVSGSYFENNHYWLSQSRIQSKKLKVFCVKYEDLLEGVECLIPFAGAIGIPAEHLQHAYGETQTRQSDGKFYWKMQSEYYKEYLSQNQLRLFCHLLEKEIRQTGYESIINNL